MSAENDPLAEVRRDRPLLPFLPLIYVAWADDELTAEEAAGIRARIEAAELEPGCRERLARWLDPESPPPARELQAILRTVRQAGGGMSDAARGSLAAPQRSRPTAAVIKSVTNEPMKKRRKSLPKGSMATSVPLSSTRSSDGTRGPPTLLPTRTSSIWSKRHSCFQNP